jgi:hypothetical protein
LFYLLGKCEDALTAQEYFDNLVEAGVSSQIIKFYPGNVAVEMNDDLLAVQQQYDSPQRRSLRDFSLLSISETIKLHFRPNWHVAFHRSLEKADPELDLMLAFLNRWPPKAGQTKPFPLKAYLDLFHDIIELTIG